MKSIILKTALLINHFFLILHMSWLSEQVKGVGGTMVCSANIPHGICIEITIPMKGDGSYQYFVS